MKVEDLLQELRELVEDAKVLPLSGGKCLIDAESIKELLDDIDDTLPQEVRQAKAIVADRQKIMADAKAEAENIIRSAEDKKKSLVTQNEIVRQAQAEANEIISDAKSKSRDMRMAVNDYVEDILRNSEELLTNQVNALKKTRQNIKASQKQPTPPPVQKPVAPNQD
ncbi:MAG: ATPase [Clostridia bacterium]|jgi:DNA repair exonuclease SbcCD ATPase subunit|nr:ATPase [Clostridia bacterium]